MLSLEDAKKYFHYDPDTGVFVRKESVTKHCAHRAGVKTGNLKTDGYVNLTLRSRKEYRAHHVAWLLMTGSWPVGFVVDHINGIRSDNRWGNLRRASQMQNCQNQRIGLRNTSGIKGVSFNNGRGKPWRAGICIAKKRYNLGCYDTKEEAAAVYIAAAKKHFGEFARAA